MTRAGAMPDLSFGVYLLHAPLTQVAHALGVLPPTAAGLAGVIATTLALALLAHVSIERPAVAAAARWSRRRPSTAMAARRTTASS